MEADATSSKVIPFPKGKPIPAAAGKVRGLLRLIQDTTRTTRPYAFQLRTLREEMTRELGKDETARLLLMEWQDVSRNV